MVTFSQSHLNLTGNNYAENVGLFYTCFSRVGALEGLVSKSMIIDELVEDAIDGGEPVIGGQTHDPFIGEIDFISPYSTPNSISISFGNYLTQNFVSGSFLIPIVGRCKYQRFINLGKFYKEGEPDWGTYVIRPLHYATSIDLAVGDKVICNVFQYKYKTPTIRHPQGKRLRPKALKFLGRFVNSWYELFKYLYSGSEDAHMGKSDIHVNIYESGEDLIIPLSPTNTITIDPYILMDNNRVALPSRGMSYCIAIEVWGLSIIFTLFDDISLEMVLE